jgi:NAD+ kinase
LKAGLVSRIDKPEALEVAREIVDYLEYKGVQVQMETEAALIMDMPGGNSDIGEMEADFMVTVGGDGTILRTAMQMREPETPIIGVNLGSRGFLTEVYPKDVRPALDMILSGDYGLEECLKLSSMNPDMDRDFPDCLNEVLVASPLPSKALDARISIDGKQILDIQADGIIAATPTGSTAYNLSAGGSIISPEVEATIVTAICPYSYFRSIVVPKDSRITIELLKPKADALVIIDGRDYTAVRPQSSIEVWASQHKARFIRFRSFYERLERRLVFRRVK